MRALILLGKATDSDIDRPLLLSWIEDLLLTDFTIERAGTFASKEALKAWNGPVITMGHTAREAANIAGVTNSITLPFPSLDNAVATDFAGMRARLYKVRFKIMEMLQPPTPKKVKVIRG